MRMTPAGSSVVLIMIIFCPVTKPEIQTRDIKEKQPMRINLTNCSTITSLKEFEFKLRAPKVYMVEDLNISITLVLTVITVIFIWCVLAYLAYHTSDSKIDDLEDVEDDLIPV